MCTNAKHKDGFGNLLGKRLRVVRTDLLFVTAKRLGTIGFHPWACSSAGRAPALQAGGHRFDPGHVHHFLVLDRLSRHLVGGRKLKVRSPSALIHT